MADDDRIAPELLAESNPAHSTAIDEEDRLRPAFVDRCLSLPLGGRGCDVLALAHAFYPQLDP